MSEGLLCTSFPLLKLQLRPDMIIASKIITKTRHGYSITRPSSFVPLLSYIAAKQPSSLTTDGQLHADITTRSRAGDERRCFVCLFVFVYLFVCLCVCVCVCVCVSVCLF